MGRMIDARWTSLSTALERRCENAERAHEHCEDKLEKVQAKVDALMAGPVASYPPIVDPK